MTRDHKPAAAAAPAEVGKAFAGGGKRGKGGGGEGGAKGSAAAGTVVARTSAKGKGSLFPGVARIGDGFGVDGGDNLHMQVSQMKDTFELHREFAGQQAPKRAGGSELKAAQTDSELAELSSHLRNLKANIAEFSALESNVSNSGQTAQAVVWAQFFSKLTPPSVAMARTAPHQKMRRWVPFNWTGPAKDFIEIPLLGLSLFCGLENRLPGGVLGIDPADFHFMLNSVEAKDVKASDQSTLWACLTGAIRTRLYHLGELSPKDNADGSISERDAAIMTRLAALHKLSEWMPNGGVDSKETPVVSASETDGADAALWASIDKGTSGFSEKMIAGLRKEREAERAEKAKASAPPPTAVSKSQGKTVAGNTPQYQAHIPFINRDRIIMLKHSSGDEGLRSSSAPQKRKGGNGGVDVNRQLTAETMRVLDKPVCAHVPDGPKRWECLFNLLPSDAKTKVEVYTNPYLKHVNELATKMPKAEIDNSKEFRDMLLGTDFQTMFEQFLVKHWRHTSTGGAPFKWADLAIPIPRSAIDYSPLHHFMMTSWLMRIIEKRAASLIRAEDKKAADAGSSSSSAAVMASVTPATGATAASPPPPPPPTPAYARTAAEYAVLLEKRKLQLFYHSVSADGQWIIVPKGLSHLLESWTRMRLTAPRSDLALPADYKGAMAPLTLCIRRDPHSSLTAAKTITITGWLNIEFFSLSHDVLPCAE